MFHILLVCLLYLRSSRRCHTLVSSCETRNDRLVHGVWGLFPRQRDPGLERLVCVWLHRAAVSSQRPLKLTSSAHLNICERLFESSQPHFPASHLSAGQLQLRPVIAGCSSCSSHKETCGIHLSEDKDEETWSPCDRAACPPHSRLFKYHLSINSVRALQVAHWVCACVLQTEGGRVPSAGPACSAWQYRLSPAVTTRHTQFSLGGESDFV